MQRTSFEHMNCSVAQCLEVVGEWWGLLIVRDAFLGCAGSTTSKLASESLATSSTKRLRHLVDDGVLERVPHLDNPPRSEYRLTGKGPRPVACREPLDGHSVTVEARPGAREGDFSPHAARRHLAF